MNCWPSGKYVHLLYIYSIHGRAPFALITASIRRGMEVISCGTAEVVMEAQVSLTVAFSSSAFSGLLFLIFLLTYPRFSMGIRSGEFCWPVKHTNTKVIYKLFGAFGSVDRCQILLEKLISIFKKLVSRKEAWSGPKFLGNGCSDVGFQKQQWTTTSRWYCTPNSSQTVKLNTRLQTLGLWASPPFLQTLGPWFLN